MLVSFLMACAATGGDAPETNELGDSGVSTLTDSCIWTNTTNFTAEEASWSGCANASLTSEFEFDPDAAPQQRTLDLSLSQVEESGFECQARIVIPTLCGIGYYLVESAEAAVTLDVQDCPSVADSAEGQYVAGSGSVRINALGSGADPGNFSGLPLQVYIQGSYDIFAEGDVHFLGAFTVTETVVADDAEESACPPAE